ncbi:hypothetical protein WA1_40930 [Scytonema hofmannii PCC 7110]|uniref:Uncharacterized protein n=1 Tax=Scytonema hofmannii PCC 7110 TaxID=128403 RepID=A0A139WUM4_9CYAN|nr:hypothetical protein [Scytonema hofmannii]KYC36107.1 hypothetical protein WA1_40930 [Scytonema hofmannii PCC 7110]
MGIETIIVIYDNDSCEVEEARKLDKELTVGRLLHRLQKRLQQELHENPDSEATKEFKKDVDILEKGYREEIPKIVDEYQKEYFQSFLRVQLPKAEENYKKLYNWTNDNDNPGTEIRKAISELRKESYEEVEANLEEQWECAWKELENGYYCRREEALALKKRTGENFENYKKFKDTVTNWFKQLDDLYKKAEPLLETENYKALYAYGLEFAALLHQARQLKKDDTKLHPQNLIVKDHEWLKSELTEYLRQYALAVFKYFYWYKNALEIVEKEKKARESYDKFRQNRRDQFIREAQDIELKQLKEQYDYKASPLPVKAEEPERIPTRASRTTNEST